MRLWRSHRSRPYFEFGIAESAHFWQIQTLQLRLGADALANNKIDEEAGHETEAEHKSDERCHTDQLSDELPGIAVEQASDVPVHTVPGASVIALAIGKQANRDDAPKSAGSMYGDRAHWIIDFHDPLHKFDRKTHQYPGDQPQNDTADCVHETAGCGDSDQAGQQSIS